MRITSKGQVTIPRAIRERYGFMPETDVEFVEQDGWIGIQRTDSSKPHAIDGVIANLTGSGSGALTTDEIMELTRSYSDDA
jgi:AbrB family looped-hinge helix DNA binding protein